MLIEQMGIDNLVILRSFCVVIVSGAACEDAATVAFSGIGASPALAVAPDPCSAGTVAFTAKNPLNSAATNEALMKTEVSIESPPVSIKLSGARSGGMSIARWGRPTENAAGPASSLALRLSLAKHRNPKAPDESDECAD